MDLSHPKRHVWILNHYASEPTGSGGTRHHCLSKNLPAHNWQATIIAASFEHNTGRQRLKKSDPFRIEVHEGVRYQWLNTPAYSGNGIRRVMNMVVYMIRALQPKNLNDLAKPDLIIGSNVHLLAVLSAWVLSRRQKVPFFFEVRDLWPETLIQLGRIKRHSLMSFLLRMVEKFLYLRSKNIVVLLPKAEEYIASRGVSREKVAWVPNGVDIDRFPFYPRRPSDVFTLMYFGAHGQANGLETIIRAFAAFIKRRTSPKCILRMVGDGPLKNSLIELSRSLNLEGAIRFEPPVRKVDIPQLAGSADAFILNMHDLPLYRFGISLNKLFDFLAAGRPVIFASNSINNPVRDANAGFCLPADDVQAMTKAIEEVVCMPPLKLQQIGLNGRMHVEKNYDYKMLAFQLAQVLSKAVLK
jgi:glycosyltransferase involved in cell wall biosynthesis